MLMTPHEKEGERAMMGEEDELMMKKTQQEACSFWGPRYYYIVERMTTDALG